MAEENVVAENERRGAAFHEFGADDEGLRQTFRPRLRRVG